MCNLAKIGKKKGVDPSLDSDSEGWVMTLPANNPYVQILLVTVFSLDELATPLFRQGTKGAEGATD